MVFDIHQHELATGIHVLPPILNPLPPPSPPHPPGLSQNPGFGCPASGIELAQVIYITYNELTHLKTPWCWERLRAGGEGDTRGWDGWMHHQLDGHGFGWTPGVGDGQGGLACCDSWGCKESDTTERLNWTELNVHVSVHSLKSSHPCLLPLSPKACVSFAVLHVGSLVPSF